jgi:lariat debranching enzyme
VVRFGGLRIAGLSGIYNERHYTCGHFEYPPYDNSTVRSAYHVRDLEVYRLLKVLYLILLPMA